MCVNRHVIPVEGAGIFNKITSHPMILAGTGHIFNYFAGITARKFSAAFAG